MGMTLVSVMLVTGNVTLSCYRRAQQKSLWFIFPLLVGFVMFVVSSLAETNRLPFDLPETESELITGYHTEYSSMKFSLFFIAEYSNLMTSSAMMATIFLGGWDIPFTTWDQGEPSVLKFVLTMFAFVAKTLVFIFVFIWVRWTLPRFRFDQLMALGWKVFLPLAVFYLMVIATASFVMEPRGHRVRRDLCAGVVRHQLGDRRRLVLGPRPGPHHIGDRNVRGAGEEGRMSIGVKVVQRPDREASYLRSALKGMALTFSHLLRPKVTMQYPEEKTRPT